MMEMEGIVSQAVGGKPREVLATRANARGKWYAQLR